MKSILFSQALAGFELAASARHLSPHTIQDYANTFRKFQAYINLDPPIDQITAATIQGFLSAQTVSNKTVLNYHTGLSALWTWALAQRLVDENPLHSITRPKPQKPDIIPLTEMDLRALLSVVERSKRYARPGKKPSTHALPDAARNRAIILTLLDTGLRASELCSLRILDVDLRNHEKSIAIHEGKGNKDRHIPISPRTATAIWKYLTTRPDARVDEPLFATSTGRKMDRNNLGNMLESTADRAGIPDVHPHRFRHTFAINFLRNGGDIYTLQAILGHESLEMCLRYLKIAQTDLEKAHRRASPVDNWSL